MTKRKLKNYIEGQGCKCYAYNSSECGCGVDWTPKEIYELRADLEFRRELYKVQTVQLDKIWNERDEARERNAKLRDIAERAIELAVQYYDGPCERDAAKLRAELDQLKEGGK